MRLFCWPRSRPRVAIQALVEMGIFRASKNPGYRRKTTVCFVGVTIQRYHGATPQWTLRRDPRTTH
jgi:hypothetical protein